MKERTRHNCILESQFEFIAIAFTKDDKDRICCKICGRIWEEIRETNVYTLV